MRHVPWFLLALAAFVLSLQGTTWDSFWEHGVIAILLRMPDTSLPNALCYEELVEAEDGNFSWVDGSEDDACGVCFTSRRLPPRPSTSAF